MASKKTNTPRKKLIKPTESEVGEFDVDPPGGTGVGEPEFEPPVVEEAVVDGLGPGVGELLLAVVLPEGVEDVVAEVKTELTPPDVAGRFTQFVDADP